MSPSEQARADALADAETLRMDWDAMMRSASLKTSGTYTPDVLVTLHPTTVAREARDMARAAFRAVPGLRGDR
jgi:ketosteroid isomerase-like protein